MRSLRPARFRSPVAANAGEPPKMKHLKLSASKARSGAFLIAALQLASCGSSENGVDPIAPFQSSGGADGNVPPSEDTSMNASGPAGSAQGTDRPTDNTE